MEVPELLARANIERAGGREILWLAVDANEDLVGDIVRTELLTPESNRFIRDDDSAFGE